MSDPRTPPQGGGTSQPQRLVPSPETLKPCPFCGSDQAPNACEDFDRQTSPMGWRVSCWKDDGGCEASGPWAETEDEAERLWNERI